MTVHLGWIKVVELPVLNDAVIPFLYVLQSKTILNCKTGVRKFHKVLIFLIVTTSQPLR